MDLVSYNYIRTAAVGDEHTRFVPGFDTASSIALLAISAVAKKGSNGKPIPPGYIIILPVIYALSCIAFVIHCGLSCFSQQE